MTPLHKLKERKLVQWALAYLAGAWVLMQLAAFLSEAYAWPALVMRVIPVLLVVGFFAALILAWYHGEKGAQRVSGVEIAMLTGILVIAGGVVLLLGREPASGGAEPAPTLAAALTADALAAEQGSIAVLPFLNMSSDSEQEYFSDGITEELLNVLAQLPELRVVSRTSAFSFKGSKTPIDSIARALRVRHVLEGSVRKAGDRIRITAQLIDASTGYHLWSETYDRGMGDVFAVQDEISGEIVRQLQLTLGGDRAGAVLAVEGTQDPEAHTRVLKALQIMRQGTREAFSEAERLFEEALERDPGYAGAHAGLADVYFNQAFRGYTPAEVGYGRARTTAERALGLDSTEWRAHNVLARIAWNRDWDWSAADRHFARTLELNPSDGTVITGRAWLLMLLGRTQEALRLGERAVAVDPVNAGAYSNLSALYFFADDLAKAMVTIEEALRLQPRSPVILANLASFYTVADRFAEAIRTAEQALQVDSEFSFALSVLGHAHARLGNRAEAERLLGRLEAMPEVSRADLAYVHAGLGNRREVVSLLERAYEERDWGVTHVGIHPGYRDYRSEPRLQRLLEKMGLPAGSS